MIVDFLALAVRNARTLSEVAVSIYHVIVWNLIHRDCDLAWSAVNSHFILGIIGMSLAFPSVCTRM